MRIRSAHFAVVAVAAFWIPLSACAETETAGVETPAKQVLISGHGVDVTRRDVANEIAVLQEDRKLEVLNDVAAFKNLVNLMYYRGRMTQLAEEYGYTDEELVQFQLRRGRERMLADLVPRRHVEGLTLPDFSEAAREFYQANIEDFIPEAEIRAAHILLRAPDAEDKERRRPEAEALVQRLRDGADFMELAKEVSEDGTRMIGGDLGFFGSGKMVPEFEEAAFALETPGEHSGVVESRFGFHIIRLLERRGGEPIPFAEVQARIIERLQTDHIQEELTAWLTAMASPADAHIDQTALDDLFLEIRTDIEASAAARDSGAVAPVPR